jgi:phosphohistidine phosphatase
MELWVIRHAIAEERSSAVEDARRALTQDGRERFERGVRGLKRLGARFELVLHSPLLRAQETADLLAPLCEGSLAMTAALAREPDEALLADLQGERVACVGHEPWCSQLLSWLVFGWRVYEDDPRAAQFRFKKGGAAVLVGEPLPGRMALAAFYPPAALRALGRR